MAFPDRVMTRLVEAIPDAALVVTADGIVASANTRATQLFQYPAGALAGRPLELLIPEAGPVTDGSWGLAGLDRADGKARSGGCEVAGRRADGGEFPAECLLSPLEDEEGHRLFLAVVRDRAERGSPAPAFDQGESCYRELFEGSPHPVWVYDRETLAFLAVNDAAVRKYGYTRQEFLAMTLVDVGAPETAGRRDPGSAQAPEEPTDAGTRRQSTKDGRILESEVVSHPMIWSGRLAELELSHEVTERRRAEEERRRRTRGLATLLEASQSLAATLDLDRVLQATVDGANALSDAGTAAVYLREGDAAVRLHATAPPLPRDFPGDLRCGLLADHRHLRDAIASGTPVVVPDVNAAELTPAERAAVETRGLRSILFLPLIAGDESLGALIVASIGRIWEPSEPEIDLCRTLANLAALSVANARLYDAVERHAADLQREIDEKNRAETALRQRRDQLEKIVATSPGAVCSFRLRADGSVSFPFAGAALEAFYGVSPERLAEDASVIFTRIHPEDVGSVQAAIADSARTLTPWHSEFRVHSPALGELWLEGHSMPLREADGSVLWHGVVLDVTERKRAEEEREALRVQLAHAQKMEAVGRLAGGVAHDFNNMLAVILGRAELGLANVGTQAPLRQHLTEILQAAERSSMLTRQLLAFARRQTASPQVLHLNAAVDATLRMLQRLIGEDVELVWTPGGGTWKVRLDPSQLDQVLANLVVNARDALGGPGRITLCTREVVLRAPRRVRDEIFPPGEYVLLTVSDDGCGMGEDILAHVFEPFFTTKAPGRGTGLGLATVYGIVRQNGGFAEVQSAPGRGTTFGL